MSTTKPNPLEKQKKNSTADIQYLLQILQKQFGALKDQQSKTNSNQQSQLYVNSFISYVENQKQKTNVIDFIDCGTKLMQYIKKNGVKDITISDSSMDTIMKDMIQPQLLKQPLTDALEQKKKNIKDNQQDIKILNELTKQLEQQPVDYKNFMKKLMKVDQL